MPGRGGKGKGGNKRRRGKKGGDDEKRELDLKGEGQEYAFVTRMLGSGRLEAQCFDGKRRLCKICGKLWKKVWVNQGDIILIGLRDFQDDKADVLHKYSPEEARRLKAQGELPDNAVVSERQEQDEAECAFDFEDI